MDKTGRNRLNFKFGKSSSVQVSSFACFSGGLGLRFRVVMDIIKNIPVELIKPLNNRSKVTELNAHHSLKLFLATKNRNIDKTSTLSHMSDLVT